MLRKRIEAGTGEAMTKELGLQDSKLTFAQAQWSGHGQGTAPGHLRDAEYERLSQG